MAPVSAGPLSFFFRNVAKLVETPRKSNRQIADGLGIALTLDKKELATALGIPAENLAPDLANIHAPVRLRRRGVEAKLLIGDHQPDPDPVLIRTLRDAHNWARALREGTPLLTIARDTAHHDAFIRTRGQLVFLSSKIQIAICDGTLPPEVH